MIKRTLTGIGMAIIWLTQTSTQASILHVNASATGSNTGATWANAYSNLQSALSAAASNDQIWVAQGTYIPGSARTDTFNVKGGIGLYGGFAGSETNLNQRNWTNYSTILSGEIGSSSATDNVYRVVSITNNQDAAVLDGFTIQRGYHPDTTAGLGAGIYIYKADNVQVRNCNVRENYAKYNGGGLYFYPRVNYTSPLTVQNSLFESNSADRASYSLGGGMYVTLGVVTVDGCTFRKNFSAMQGGGLGAGSQASVTLNNSRFEQNSAVYGGGSYIYPNNKFMLVENCVWIGNTSDYNGAGFYLNNAQASNQVRNCLFLGNVAGRDGGGVYNVGSDVAFLNCVFSGNEALGSGGTGGGGLANYNNANPTLANCTFANNRAKNGGGMIDLATSSSPALTNCIFWGNSVTNNGSQIYQNVAGTLRLVYSDVENGTNGVYMSAGLLVMVEGMIQSNPLFTDADGVDNIAGTADDDLTLTSSSPCLDKGTPEGAPVTDLLGVARPQGTAFDMGAYERPYTVPPVKQGPVIRWD